MNRHKESLEQINYQCKCWANASLALNHWITDTLIPCSALHKPPVLANQPISSTVSVGSILVCNYPLKNIFSLFTSKITQWNRLLWTNVVRVKSVINYLMIKARTIGVDNWYWKVLSVSVQRLRPTETVRQWLACVEPVLSQCWAAAHSLWAMFSLITRRISIWKCVRETHDSHNDSI